jgi:hypothetical protein
VSPRKLVLCVVDSLRTDKLQHAAESGQAPTFAALLERGSLIGDCVSAFPSVTPVCTSEIATGHAADRHWISGMNWYHRAERRYVEYGSSFEASRSFGLFRSLYDTVYNMNMAHLSDEVETVFERLGDHGVRTACTPFLIYRGRKRHEMGLEGLLRRVAVAATFRHATWGPDELFYGELYSSRRVPCKPTLARPGTRDEYSACCGRELVENDLYDFLLYSLPDNDYHSHKYGPEEQPDSIAGADAALAELVDACDGLESFLAEHAVIVIADHAQTAVDQPLPLIERLGERWRVLQPNECDTRRAELAVCPSSRAAAVYVLDGDDRARFTHAGVRAELLGLDGVDLTAWLELDGLPVLRGELTGGPPHGCEAVVAGHGAELRFRPGGAVRDRRGGGWEMSGDRAALLATAAGDRFDSEAYPDALARLWSALIAPYAGEVLVSLAPGYECVDWGGVSHCPGGSHGSLAAGDSLGPLLFCGLEPGTEAIREQWAIRDVAALIHDHFGTAEPPLTVRRGASVGARSVA